MYREIMWTEESESHIARHQVAPREVEEVVNSRPIYTAVGRQETTLVYGSAVAGGARGGERRPLVRGDRSRHDRRRGSDLSQEGTMTMARKKAAELRDYYDTTDTSEVLEGATLEQPETSVEPMVTYALRLPQPVLEKLRDVASRRGVRVSGLMRTWLEERLGRESAGQEAVIAVDDLLALVAERAKIRPGVKAGTAKTKRPTTPAR